MAKQVDSQDEFRMISKQKMRVYVLVKVLFITALVTGKGNAEQHSEIITKLFMRSYDPRIINIFQKRHELYFETPDPCMKDMDIEQANHQNTVNVDIAQTTLQRIRRYDPMILYYSDRYDIPPNLIRAVICVESGGHPTVVSSKGAVGLMQLMPRTAEDMGITNILDPRQNVHGGVKYLRFLLDYFGKVEQALWAYNAGPSALLKSRKIRIADRYVENVLSFKSLLDHRDEEQIYNGRFSPNRGIIIKDNSEWSRFENGKIHKGTGSLL